MRCHFCNSILKVTNIWFDADGNGWWRAQCACGRDTKVQAKRDQSVV